MKTEILNCGTCRACCHQLVVLTDEDWRSRTDWETQANGLMLAARDDGGCIYLDDEKGCTIYDHRPELCRAFHCGKWIANNTRQWRKTAEKDARKRGNRQFLRMLKEGAQRRVTTNQQK